MKKRLSIFAIVLLLAAIQACQGCSTISRSESQVKAQTTKEPVFFVGGGTIDDFVASVLTFTMDDIDYLGMEISNSDCIYNYAMQVQWKLQSYINKSSYPLGLSDARGFNAFPWQYRNDCYLVWKSSVFNGYDDNPASKQKAIGRAP